MSAHGFWVFLGDREVFLPFVEFPWFRDAPISAVLNIVRPARDRLRWPDLDVDLAVDSIDRPEDYPLVAKETEGTYPEWRGLACDFLHRFSRFEYALKRTQYCKANGGVRVEWRRFARENEDRFDFTVELSDQIAPLLRQPPARQVVRDGTLDWEDEGTAAADGVTLEWLLEMVYRVRNNLFHGGKWPPDPSRDPALLRSSMAVIEACLELDENLRAEYGVGR